MTVPAKQESLGTGSMESVLARGDLSKLNEQQRTDYYISLCKSLGLNPLTQPFEYLTLNSKLVLYAKRACADQLRKINGISLQVVSQDQSDGLLTVHVRAKDQTGREDEDLGVVSLPDTLKGEARANAILKAVTKGKRRVTLSICGLGFLDETEVEDIPSHAKAPPTTALAPKALPPHDPQTGELLPTTQASDAPLDWIKFGQDMIAAVGKPDFDKHFAAQAEQIAKMKEAAPKVHARMMAAIEKAKPPSPADDPEKWLKWLKAQCAAIIDPAVLDQFEKSQAEAFKQAFPPDAEQGRFIIAQRTEALANA
jgi:hypothetical protein